MTKQILVTSNEKTQNYKVVDLVEEYNYRIKLIIIQVLEKIYEFSKVRSSHPNIQYEWHDKLDTWNMQ